MRDRRGSTISSSAVVFGQVSRPPTMPASRGRSIGAPGPQVVITWLRRIWPCAAAHAGSLRKRLTLGSTSRRERLTRNLRSCAEPRWCRACRAVAAQAGSTRALVLHLHTVVRVVVGHLAPGIEQVANAAIDARAALVALGVVGEGLLVDPRCGTARARGARARGGRQRSARRRAAAVSAGSRCRASATSAPAKPRSSARAEKGVTLRPRPRGRRCRGTELADLAALGRLAAWDQRTMMPPAGGPGARRAARDARAARPRARDGRRGRRVARRAGAGGPGRGRPRHRADRAPRLRPPAARPGELAAELAQASVGGPGRLGGRARGRRLRRVRAGAAPQRRARARVRGLLRRAARPYDALLADYDYGSTAERLHEVFGALRASSAAARRRGAARRPRRGPPVAAQGSPSRPCCAARRRRRRLAPRRLRPPVHRRRRPRDSRVTTRYEDGQLCR